MNTNNILTENLIFSGNDIIINLNKWKPIKGHNILFVTGLSGSGKTTVAENMEKKYKSYMFEIDGLIHNYDSSNKNILNRVKKQFPQLEYMYKSGKVDGTICAKALDIVLDLMEEDYSSLYIIEGIQIFDGLLNKDISNKPLLIKNTSALTSSIRVLRRTYNDNKKITTNDIRNLLNLMKSTYNKFELFKTNIKESSINDIFFIEANLRYESNTSAIKNKLWPIVEASMNKPATKTAYKKLLNEFISMRVKSLYDTLPCDRLLCSDIEMDKLFDVLKINKKDVKTIIDETYYGPIDNFNPLAAKHEFTVTQLLVIRYFMLNKMHKECELAMIHLAFSGKFYPSVHYRSYPTVTPVRHIMEYVVNNRLSKKFDLTTHGSVFGAIKSVGNTWIDTYKDRFKTMKDEDVVYLIQQLHSRVGSFVKNIANEYYDVYEEKDLYINYSSDSYEENDFHLADSDTLKVSRITEKAVNMINTNGVDYRICKMCSNNDITPNECKSVIESIVSQKENIYTIKELISLMVSLYFVTGERDISDIKFITYTIAPKPNAKQKEIVRLKEIIEDWLCESGTAYMRRRSRIATRNSYERAVRMYFALVIHNSSR